MVDKAVVKRILTSLDESLRHLEEKKGASYAEYQRNKDLRAIVERRLETAIMASIDIGSHIISQENLGSPGDYGEIFMILAQNDIISVKDAENLKKMAGFRNILAHEYRDILNQKVYDVLQNRLDDFYGFLRSIVSFLEKT